MVQPRAQAGMSSLWTSLRRPWRGGAGEGAEKFKGERTHAGEVSGYPGQDPCGLQAEKLRLLAPKDKKNWHRTQRLSLLPRLFFGWQLADVFMQP